MSSLAFGHRDIPSREEDIEVDAKPDSILSATEAVERVFFVAQLLLVQPLHNSRTTTCIWEEDGRQRVENAKELVGADLGFDEPEETDESDQEPDVDTRLTHIIETRSFLRDALCDVNANIKSTLTLILTNFTHANSASINVQIMSLTKFISKSCSTFVIPQLSELPNQLRPGRPSSSNRLSTSN